MCNVKVLLRDLKSQVPYGICDENFFLFRLTLPQNLVLWLNKLRLEYQFCVYIDIPETVYTNTPITYSVSQSHNTKYFIPN